MTIQILPVDDEADILRLVRIKLEKVGFEGSAASDDVEGVEKALSEKPDIMVIDVMMPTNNGYQVIAKVKDKLGDAAPACILPSPKGQERDVLKKLTSGADDYSIKLFSPRELVERINVILVKNQRIRNDNQSESEIFY
ncbi:MAG: response regulator transcription factor [Thermovirgaceae bacterium]|nr:response regulator transcription factor [Thermovirgaceae bacterium]